eukprot:g7468.t1
MGIYHRNRDHGVAVEDADARRDWLMQLYSEVPASTTRASGGCPRVQNPQRLSAKNKLKVKQMQMLPRKMIARAFAARWRLLAWSGCACGSGPCQRGSSSLSPMRYGYARLKMKLKK